MEIRLVTPDGVAGTSVDDLPGLLAREDGVLWVDIPEGDPDAGAGARRRVRLPPQGGAGLRPAHPRAEGARLPRPRVRRPARARSRGAAGTSTTSSSTSSSGERYLVTVHGPVNPAVDPAAAQVETDAVAARLDGGRFAPAVRPRAVDGDRLGADRADARPPQRPDDRRCGASSSR